jgi:hypothetical protein
MLAVLAVAAPVLLARRTRGRLSTALALAFYGLVLAASC